MTVKSRSILAAGAIATTAVLALVGCSGGSGADDSGDTTKLTVWVDAERVDALKGVAASYKDKTGITVDLVSKANADIKDDFTQQAPTGKGPDIVMGAHDWLGELVRSEERRVGKECPV